MAMNASPLAPLLALPSELRNAIYMHVFEPDHPPILPSARPNPIAIALQLHDEVPYTQSLRTAIQQLRVLQTCKQIRAEAQLLALAITPFHITGEGADPEEFARRTRAVPPAQLAGIRHVVLTARISHLRALNERWGGAPFGHRGVRLDRLVVIPTRPEVYSASYAEITDLSQSHTLAHVFCETLKQLKQVRCVEVRNHGCFNEVVWRLLYRSLVYRIWRWGGGKCGMRFENGEVRPGGSERRENQWFRVFLQDDDDDEGAEVGEEVVRLVGQTGEVPDPNLAGIGL